MGQGFQHQLSAQIYDEEVRSKHVEGLKSVKALLSDKNSSLEVAKRIYTQLFEE